MVELYRGILRSGERAVYDKIRDSLAAQRKSIQVQGGDTAAIARIFELVLLDHPELFFVRGNIRFAVRGAFLLAQTEVFPDYAYNPQEIERINTVCRRAAGEIAGRVRGLNDYEKELLIHDYFCRTVKYSQDGFESHSIVGVFLHKRAVCEGIAKAVKYVFDLAGLESFVMKGSAESPHTHKSEPHAWNVVKIHGSFYHLDVTFDLSLSDGGIRYDYFNLSDADVSAEHHFTPVAIGVCAKNDLAYFRVNNMIVSSPKELERYILQCLRMGKNPIAFKYTGADKKSARSAVSSQLQSILTASGKCRSLTVGYNESQLVFEVKYS